MNKKELEGNTLIGVFMGAKLINDAPGDFPNGYYLSDFDSWDPEDWQFSTSWDWLMEVVMKIYKIEGSKTELTIHNVSKAELTIHNVRSCVPNNIKLAFKAVVNFINWYNEI